MEKLEMQTINKVDENVEKIGKLFPNCITETVDVDGKVIKVVDFDLLRQELSSFAVEGADERYQFNWADKKKSILLANSPINKTLRPCREESVNFDTTQNLYIEGDNLDVLKLLQETYMGKVKMIYIDPPYNTGNDFVYEDDFAISAEEYFERSGMEDEDGNRLFQNNDSNGRFHTDWLNMMYPRLRLAKDLLADDGVIFISIDDNEVHNLRKICDEVFGTSNFVAVIPILSNPRGRQSSKFFAETHEYILCYAKNANKLKIKGEELTEKQKSEYKEKDERGSYRLLGLRLRGGRATAAEAPTLHFPIYYDIHNNDFYLDRKSNNDYEIIPKFEDGTLGTWRWGKKKIIEQKHDLIVKPVKDRYDVFQKDYLLDDKTMKLKSLWHENDINYDNSARELQDVGIGKLFDYAKPLYLIKKIIKCAIENNDIILDFFSGSATTAHAVMQLNAEDGGKRKYIMVQLPEETDEKSEAYKAGYKNICEIGKERIRRAGEKIISDYAHNKANNLTKPLMDKFFENKENREKQSIYVNAAEEVYQKHKANTGLDIGFRVLKIDSSNMKPVFYNPNETTQDLFSKVEDNIKDGRNAEDLLFQVMLDMGIELSSDITVETIGNKTVYTVGGDNLICCFDTDITKDTVTEIAKRKPLYAIFRDNGFERDDTLVSFDQIFATYSPTTERKVL